MKKCAFCFIFVFVTLITAAFEDICKSCVSLSKCPQLTSMSRQDQEFWMLKYPCNNHHPDDYGTPPGSKASQGHSICCPTQIWGMESKDSSSHLENRFGRSPQGTPGSFTDQSQYLNNYDNIRLNKENDSEANLSTNRRGTPSQNHQASRNIQPSRLPLTYTNNYWNQRPDRSKWDIGNRNFYHGNNNNNRNLFNNIRRNYYDNGPRAGANQGARRNQPDDRSNDQGYKRKDYGDTFDKSGQCDRLTRFPPDPQRGCCGREASDDDRIIDAPSYDNFAPGYNRGWKHEQEPDYKWSYSMFKESTNTTVINKTVTVVNETQGVNSTVTVDNRISGGKATELTQFPWTALLVATFNNGNQQTAFNCGGSVISAKFVLTAGHCVYDAEAVLKSVQVFLAEFDKRTFPRDCKTTPEGRKCIENIAINSEDVILHPRFDEKRLQNDIALIKLQSDAPSTDYIRPICLPSINIDNPEHNRLPLTVAGWGRNGQYKTDIKQSTTVHLVPQHDCRKFYPDLTPRHLCAAGYSGEDTCKGDSGGPLMVRYRGVYYVVGVVSGKRTDAPCGSAVPSLYTNVYHYLDWIRSNIGN